MLLRLDDKIEKQILQSIKLLENVLKNDLLGVYLYGSAVVGGLQKYSDLDFFVVSNRATTTHEKSELIKDLLIISGIYMKERKPPIEMTIVVESAVNPWRYPPKFDFQYGEWLRENFARDEIEPWATKEMPELAVLITQVLLANKVLLGPNPEKLLCKVPYQDFLCAITATLEDLMINLDQDIRNVLLALARTWSTVKTDTIRTKPAAAVWAIEQLPAEYKPVIRRANAICTGVQNEYWDDIESLIHPCANFMAEQIKYILSLKTVDNIDRTISLFDSKKV